MANFDRTLEIGIARFVLEMLEQSSLQKKQTG